MKLSRWFTRLPACLLFSLVISQTALAAQDPARLQEQLQALEAEIEKFRTLLQSTEGERTNLEKTLETNEKDINQILRRIEDIQKDLEKGEDKLSSLSRQQEGLQAKKSEQQSRIAEQVRAAYMLGKQPHIKVVLNQQDPHKLSRMLNYYNFIGEARRQEISDYEETLAQLTAIATAIADQNLALIEHRGELEAERAGLLTTQAKRRQTLVALNREIKETGNILEARQADRERLESLIATISRGINNLPAPGDDRPFAELQGNLLLPVVGQVKQKFGTRRSEGKLTWNGVFIEAGEGSPVHSVHYGRVVFSDWLRGFGLLMIVSHGEGYMSLYGHNQVLYRETGDWVAAGEMIAAVGNTGGQQAHGLYFEIRQAGKPADPLRWCQVRTQNRAA